MRFPRLRNKRVLPEHPRKDEGYTYVEPSEIINAKIVNADYDAIFFVKDGRKYLVEIDRIVRYK